MKDLLLHDIPIIVVGVGAIFGLTADESNGIAQGLTGLVTLVFAVGSIWRHKHVKKSLTAQK